MKIFLVIIVIMSAVAFQGQALAAPAARGQAQIIGDDLSGPGSDLDATRVVNIIRGFSCWLLRFAIITVSIVLVFYGILYLKSRGSPEGLSYAKKALKWGIVGSVVIFGVFTIVMSLAALLGIDYPIMSMINC